MASMFHFIGPALFGQSGFNGLLRAFQQAVRGKAYEDVQNLVQTVRRLAWQEMPEVLGPLANAAPECLSAIINPGVTTDAALIVLQSLISRMEVMVDSEYRVEHDQSKNLLQYGELIQRFIRHDKEIEFRQTEITSLKFPLKLRSVTQVNSKSSPAVQIADILIGAAIDSTKSLAGLPNRWGENPLDIFRFYNDDQLIHLMPSLDFEEQKRFRSGNKSNEMIDYFSNNFYRKI